MFSGFDGLAKWGLPYWTPKLREPSKINKKSTPEGHLRSPSFLVLSTISKQEDKRQQHISGSDKSPLSGQAVLLVRKRSRDERRLSALEISWLPFTFFF